jgi:NhaP-type Na+/H+ or K+/H+ antiporter
MGRWRTWLIVVGLVLTTPLVGGCLTTMVARGIIHKVREHKSKHETEADESRAEKREKRHREAPPEQQEASEEPAR